MPESEEGVVLYGGDLVAAEVQPLHVPGQTFRGTAAASSTYRLYNINTY